MADLTSDLAPGGRLAWDDSLTASVRIAILAGGRGTRLAPYTSVLPKPLMPVGDKAILEIVLTQLANAGFRQVTLCVGYLSHLIRAVLNGGADHGVELTYVDEYEPSGTAGPLRMIEGLDSTFIAMNGDVLTTLDYRALLRAHKESGNIVTIATNIRTMQIDYGILRLGESTSNVARITAYDEKPSLTLAVSMGVYVIEPAALEYIPQGIPFDFPHLVQSLLEANEPIGSYEFDGFWLDIGRYEDYEEANRLYAGLEDQLLTV